MNVRLSASPALRVEELQLAGAVRIHEHRQHFAAEQARQHVDMDEEVGARRDPSRAVEREPSAWHDHVHVRMMRHRRSPCVEHGCNANPGAEALWIGGDGERGFGRRLHEQVIDDALVLISDIAQLTGQRVDNVEVADGQQLGFARGEPFLCRRALALGAVAVAATVVADDGVSTRTVLATRDMTSERCRAAALDRTHHLHLVEADMPRVSRTPSGAVVAEDVRDLQRWSNHNRRR